MSKPTVTINGQPLADQARVSLVAGEWTIKASDSQAFVNVGGNPRARGQVTLRAEAGKSYNVAVTGGFFAALTATAPVVTPTDPKPEPKPFVPIRMMEGSTDVVDAAWVARARAATISGPFAVRKWATLTRTCDGFGNIPAIATQARTIIAGGGIPLVTIHIWRDSTKRPTVYPTIDINRAAEQGRKACDALVASGMPKSTILQFGNEVNNNWMSFWPSGDWRLGFVWWARFAKAFKDAGFKCIGPSMAGFYHLAQQVCDYIEANGLQTAFDGIAWNFYGEKGTTPAQPRHAACIKVMLDFAAKHGIEAWGIECGPPFNEPEAIYAEYTPHVIENVSKLHGWGFWRQEMLPRWDTRVENGKTVLADSALYRRDKTPYPLLAVYQKAISAKPRVTVRDCIWSTKRTQRPYVPIVPGAQRIIGIRPEDAAQIAQVRTIVAAGDPVYVDHFAQAHATLDDRNAALAAILPGMAAAGPVVLYDTIRRYDLTGVGGTESAQREQNDRTMRTLGQWLYGVGISLYCFDSTTPAYVTADVREAVRISGGKPVVGFVSPHWAGRADRGLVPMDTYRAYVRAAIDAGASEIVVWAHVGDAEPSTLANYVQTAMDEANR